VITKFRGKRRRNTAIEAKAEGPRSCQERKGKRKNFW